MTDAQITIIERKEKCPNCNKKVMVSFNEDEKDVMRLNGSGQYYQVQCSNCDWFWDLKKG